MQCKLGCDVAAVAEAYTQSLLPLNRSTVQIREPIWSCLLDNGNVVALGCDSDVNPRRFDQLTLYYSTPEAAVKTRVIKRPTVPKQAKHHKYAHTIDTTIVVAKRGPAEDQELARRVHDMYTMMPRKDLQKVVAESKKLLHSKLPAQVRRIVNACVLPPETFIQPVYYWQPTTNKRL